jgi:hypothetical protein
MWHLPGEKYMALLLQKGLQAGKQEGWYSAQYTAQYNVETLSGEEEKNGILV